MRPTENTMQRVLLAEPGAKLSFAGQQDVVFLAVLNLTNKMVGVPIRSVLSEGKDSRFFQRFCARERPEMGLFFEKKHLHKEGFHAKYWVTC